jgi:hypothetical protein
MGMTMAVGGIASSVIGGGMNAMARSQSANYNAQVARNNQTIANQNASLSLQQGQQQEENQRLKTGEQIGSIVAGQAASGVNPNTGSALNVRASAAEVGELDAETIRYNAGLKARDLLYQGSMYGAQAQLDSSQGEWGVANSLLSGASSVAGKWLSYQQSGSVAGKWLSYQQSGVQ